MCIFDGLSRFIEYLTKFIFSINFIIFIASIIVFYNIIIHFIRDRNYIRVFKKSKDPEIVKLEDLRDLPLVNIIIPAWKEGELFNDCLLLITNLIYPNLKVIISAGGNEETIQIRLKLI